MVEVEVEGVAEYKEFDPNVMAVFLLPPSFKEWQERLQRRYGDVVDAADARMRMETGLEELEQLLNTNYYMPVVNDDIEKAFAEIQEITKTGRHEDYPNSDAHKVAEKFAQDIQKHLEETA